jgi:hypothetical protein
VQIVSRTLADREKTAKLELLAKSQQSFLLWMKTQQSHQLYRLLTPTNSSQLGKPSLPGRTKSLSEGAYD